MLGALLALLSAATFGLNNAAIRRGVLSGSVLQALSITVPLGAVLFALVALAAGALSAIGDFSAAGIGWLAAAGVVHFVIGRYGNYRATRAMGANLSGPVQQASVLVSLVLALAFLGETLTPLRIVGIVLIVAGPMIMLRGRGRRRSTPSGFVPDLAEGYAYSLLCAVGYGVSPLFIRLGLEDGGLGASLAGGTISYGAATLVLAAILLLPGKAAHVRAPDGVAARWFLASGLLVFLSQVFRYMALAVAPVSVVVPIQRLSVVFRALFSWLINRDHELFGFWVLSGIGVSVVGALALTVSTEWLLSTVSLPAALASMARWTWP
ncbi:MAG: EamA family transporter [Inquilinus sp.]|nr:EamA family transporter [Inquilinus sp.]